MAKKYSVSLYSLINVTAPSLIIFLVRPAPERFILGGDKATHECLKRDFLSSMQIRYDAVMRLARMAPPTA